jgi:sensor histidine kinase YesM
MGGAFILSLFFNLVLQGTLFHPNLWSMITIAYVQLEVFMWLGYRFFRNIKRDQGNYKRKMIVRLLQFYLTVLAISLLVFVTVYTLNFILGGSDFSYYFVGLKEIEMKGFISAVLIGFSLGALFFFYVQWTESLQREQKLAQEKLIFQYQTLKNQVNPHFLFNSLNTLSSLVRENPDLSEEFIQKLAHIYRYILNEKEKELVPLSGELNFVNDYFYLRKIRDEEKIELKIEISNGEEMEVLPVSLQLLVENALKHNAATRSNPLVIIIHNEGLDKLVVRNNLQKKTRLEESSGIGLKNLNERSRLILNKEIEVYNTVDEFIVKLPVKIFLK